MTRNAQRKLSSWLMVTVGSVGSVAALHFGLFYYLVATVPIAGLGVLGAFGVNVFRRGALEIFDPSLDRLDFVGEGMGAPTLRFEQHRGRVTRVVEVFGDRIVTAHRWIGTLQRSAVTYESLYATPIEFTPPRESVTPIWLYVGLGAMGLLFLLVVPFSDPSERLLFLGGIAFLALLAWFFWWMDHRKLPLLLQLSDGDYPLVVFADCPSPESVRAFLASLRERRAAYLAGNPAVRIGGTVVETLERLFELRESGAITSDEYERLKAEAIKQVPPAGERPGQYL